MLARCAWLGLAALGMLLGGCSDSPDRSFSERVAASTPDHRMVDVSSPGALAPVLALRRRALAAAGDADAQPVSADQFFAWAEAMFPQLFPAGQPTQEWTRYRFRYYKATDLTLAIEDQARVIALGRLTGNQIVGLGSLSDYAGKVRSLSNPSYYAAARFLEQASFGPTVESIAEVQSLGLPAWIDRQRALAPKQIDWSSVDFPDLRAVSRDHPYFSHLQGQWFLDAFIGEADQLRLRTTWALSNFMVVSRAGQSVTLVGIAEYFNHLQRHAFGSFEALLSMLIRNPSMGKYLDNVENRYGCPECRINENFARELLQLFTIGTFKLHRNGTPVLDGNGRPIEAFSQRDVRELARALTGWVPDASHVRQVANWGSNNLGYERLMKPIPIWHDPGAKTILGVQLPAGQAAEQDLSAVVGLLVNHPNTPVFISRRLIQALVSSDPSPQYLERVVAVFENDGSGARGNLGAVVKAILLDPEAREGDDPKASNLQAGRIKEPLMVATSMTRALGCKWALYRDAGLRVYGNQPQTPFNAKTVFGFTSPDHRVPGSGLNAPEQKLLDLEEFSEHRLGGTGIEGWAHRAGPSDKNFLAAKCEHQAFSAAIQKSDEDFMVLVAQRLFRGQMPSASEAVVRRALARARKMATASDPTYRDPLLQATFVLGYASVTNGFGVVR